MNKVIESTKTNVREDYKPCNTICSICKRIGKQKSKQFSTLYALNYHLATEHDREDEISAGVTRKQIRQTTKAISKALNWQMLIDLRVDTDLMSKGQEML